MKHLRIFIIFILFIPIFSIKAHAKTIEMGEFKITYYCPCEKCSEGYGRKTASQTYAQAEKTVAVDPTVINLGSKILIDGDPYIAEDVGGAVDGDHIDVFVNTHQETIDKGIEYKDVKIIRE